MQTIPHGAYEKQQISRDFDAVEAGDLKHVVRGRTLKMAPKCVKAISLRCSFFSHFPVLNLQLCILVPQLSVSHLPFSFFFQRQPAAKLGHTADV